MAEETAVPYPTITVTIKARPMLGKTTVALLIEDALKKAGFAVQFDDTIKIPSLEGEKTFQEHRPEVLERVRAEVTAPGSERVKRIAAKSRIVIEQVQTRRDY